MHRSADAELDLARCEVFEDVAGVGQRPRKPIELCDDQRVAAATRRQRLAQAWTIAIGSGQAVIDVGALDLYAERCQRIALRGEVLIVS